MMTQQIIKSFCLLSLIVVTKISIAQYSGIDTAKSNDNSASQVQPSTPSSPNRNPNIHKTQIQHQQFHRIQIHPIQTAAVTFYYDNNSKFLCKLIGRGLDTTVVPLFGANKGSIISKRPISVGYQYHFRDRWTFGVVYSRAQIKTDTLNYPDFDNPGKYSLFRYVVNLSAFMGTVDYCWKIRNKPNRTMALYSGIALGNSRIDYTTVREKSDKGNSYIPTFSGGINLPGAQITIIAIKQNFRSLSNFGYHAALGAGVNSIGLSWGVNYTF